MSTVRSASIGASVAELFVRSAACQADLQLQGSVPGQFLKYLTSLVEVNNPRNLELRACLFTSKHLTQKIACAFAFLSFSFFRSKRRNIVHFLIFAFVSLTLLPPTLSPKANTHHRKKERDCTIPDR